MGQNCQFALSGKLTDSHSSEVMSDASIFIKELNKKLITDGKGQFSLTEVCPGDYHLEVNHIGCVPKTLYINLKKDTVLFIEMHHFSELIDEVEVHGKKEVALTQNSSTLTETEVANLGNKGLSKSIEELSGVSSLSNGGAIAKPVIHGMWGNRVSIINNGIAQSGQQWGTDHAPEIDPFVANHISVIKGASALSYGGASLGGVVLVEQSEIANDPHIHGNLNYIFQSNGLGNTLNASFEQSKTWGRWRLNGTVKLIGDRKSPNYFLTNTGNREANIALTYQKRLGMRYKHQLYYSLFNTHIGILRGSHISNSSDLESAFGRDEPFFTKDYFSYKLEAPQQKVKHHLAKYKGDWQINDRNKILFKYGGQWNNRKEFDVRRNGRSNEPALSIMQINQFLEVKNNIITEKNWFIENGMQYTFVDNTNDNASTGRLPLIPDYRSNQGSAFSIFKRNKGLWAYEFGARVDYKSLEVLTITDTIPREIVRHQHEFLNYNLSSGLAYSIAEHLKIKLDLGYVQRQPEVNELYSSGLHQGLASIEYGNPNLNAENSFKTLIEIEGDLFKHGVFQVVGYYQSIQDYIFLKPTGMYEVNISGSFPVFVYDQTNATIFGSDITLAYLFAQHISASVQVSLLKGNDVKDNIPLIFMPPNNGLAKLSYTFDDGKNWSNSKVGLSGKYVAKQNHLNDDQDFVPPPEAYFLLGLEAATNRKVGNNTLQISLRVDNMLNTVYRDYLNRQRYFADDLGINFQVRLGYKF